MPAGPHQAKWLLAGLCALGLVKLRLALNLDLFGDEAFYWLEGRHLAWAYSDVPPLTAWLIRAGTELFGDSRWGARSLALIAGTAVPWLVYRLARDYVPAARAAAAGALSLGLPLVLSLGLLALPDVWINVLWLVLLIRFRQALDGGVTRWLWVGLAAALGLMTHYRFAVLIAALAGYLLATRRGRALLRGSGPWLAAAVAALGALPSLWFNVQHDFAALGFQLRDRHHWSFQSEGLLQPLVQALAATPGLFLLLVVAAVIVIRRARCGGDRWALLAWAGLLPWLFYWLLAPFADQERTSSHWPLAAYLPLCVALPEAVAAARRWLARRLSPRLAGALPAAAVGLGALAGTALMTHLEVVSARADWQPPTRMLLPDNLVGWRQASSALTKLRAEQGAGEKLIADNFMLAAQLAFEGGGREPVYALDHPLNHKHGRALQLRIWGLDERGIGRGWEGGWLVIEETATDLAQRPSWLREVCARFPGAELIEDLALYGGRKRFLYYRLQGGGGPCDLPAFAYLDAPLPGQRLRGRVQVRGWAFEDQGGVIDVEILIDGIALGRADYGLSNPGVQAFFPGSTDPNHPLVGFEFELDTGTLAEGNHWLWLRTTAADGGVRVFDRVPIVVDKG